jgi:hypothetical protein
MFCRGLRTRRSSGDSMREPSAPLAETRDTAGIHRCSPIDAAGARGARRAQSARAYPTCLETSQLGPDFLPFRFWGLRFASQPPQGQSTCLESTCAFSLVRAHAKSPSYLLPPPRAAAAWRAISRRRYFRHPTVARSQTQTARSIRALATLEWRLMRRSRVPGSV